MNDARRTNARRYELDAATEQIGDEIKRTMTTGEDQSSDQVSRVEGNSIAPGTGSVEMFWGIPKIT